MLLSLLRQGCNESSVGADQAQLVRLAQLCHRVHEWNQRINLTGHATPEAIARRLVLDAVGLLPELGDFESLVDVGSGAGFPGLPLAILRPAARIVLVEARERRHHFQRAVVRELGLGNAHPLRGRIEDLEPEPCDVVVAQAVGVGSEMLPALLDWTGPRGVVAIPGGEEPPDPGRHPELRELDRIRYQVPCGGPSRSLWLGRR